LTVFALSTGNKVALGLIALVFVAFSLTVSMVIPRYRPGFPGRHLNAFLAVCALFFVAMLFAVFVFGREAEESEAQGESTPEQPVQTQTGVTETTGTETTASTESTETETETEGGSPGGGSADLVAGKAAWDKGACGGCHTLAAADAKGTVGPDLDTLAPDESTVAHQVENGGGGMPAFKGVLTDEQIKAVSAYVAQSAGKS
jgi:mono/diheme cytochrome c family protein